MNSEEKAQLQALLKIIRSRHPRPVTWRVRAHCLKIEWRTHAQVRKAGRSAQTPPIRFCVFAPGRTGSTLLLDLANSHPDVQCESNAKQTELLRDMLFRPRTFVEARAKLCPARAYGFKTKVGQLARQYRLDPPSFLQGLHEDGWKMIYLTRRNMLRQTISQVIARQTDVWHRVRDHEGTVRNAENRAVENEKIALDIPLLLRALDHAQQNHDCAEIIWRHILHLKLEYENDLFTPAQQGATMARVFEYLGLPPHPVSTRFVRSSKDDWRDALSNPREVEAAVRGTPYEKFLDES